MKKLLFLVLGIVIGYFISHFSNPEAQIAADENQEIVKPKGVITSQKAQVLDRAFNRRHKLISDSLVKRADNRSSWWSIKDINDYLIYAENQAGDLGYTMNGIRVYIAAHPSNNGRPGLSTMFIAPTGYRNVKQGSMLNLNMYQGNGDIPGGDPLNDGDNGNPPQGNYPQGNN